MKPLKSRVLFVVLLCIFVFTVVLGVRPGPAAISLDAPYINKVEKTDFNASSAVSTGVLLLAPGLSIGDCQGEPALARLLETNAGVAIGLMPTRSGGAPDDLAAACETLARGERGAPDPHAVSLGNRLRKHGVRVVLLDPANENASLSPSRSLVGDAPPLPPLSPVAALRANDAGAADGFVTNPDGVASETCTNALTASRGNNPAWPPPRARLVLILFDDLRRTDAYAPLALPRATAEQRRNALRRLARLITLLTDEASAPQTRPDFVLLVAPLPSRSAQEEAGERVAPVFLWRGIQTAQNGTVDDLSPLLLTSPSTRRTPGLIANTDIAATVAALFGLPESERHIGAGRAAQTLSQRGKDNNALAFLTRQSAKWAAQGREQRVLVAVPWALAALLLASYVWRESRPRLALASRVAALAFPAALWLGAGVSLLEPSVSVFWGAGVVVAFAVSAAFATSARFDTRRAVLALAAFTVATLWADTVMGGPLLARSPLSYSVQEAARFYGLGNEAEGVFLGASLVVAGALSAASPSVILLWGGTVCAVFALPGLGADAGGLAAALVGCGTLLSCHLARRFAWTSRQKALSAALSVLLIISALAAFAVLDARRGPGARSHVGEAVASAREYGPDALRAIATRKAGVGARLLFSSPWSLLLAVEITLLALALRRPRRAAAARLKNENAVASPENAQERDTLTALCVVAIAALLLNDSGVVAASLCLLFAMPPVMEQTLKGAR